MAKMFIDDASLTEIADHIRAKTGGADPLELPGGFTEAIDSITGGGGGAEDVILAPGKYPFIDGGGVYVFQSSLYPGQYPPQLFTVKNGTGYKVAWDGTEYTCTAFTAELQGKPVIGVGNAALVGMPSPTNEPFLMGYFTDGSDTVMMTAQTGAEHTVGIVEPLLCYVTFYNGAQELTVKPTAAGDDCADVISRGIISTPTKPPVPQYSYTFAGWSKMNNNVTDPSALKAITADRNVYATFAAVSRKYTIRWLDDNGSLLKQEQVSYGITPSFVPKKDGYTFSKWKPTPVPVTADASYMAVWAAETLDDYSWSQIEQMAQAGTLSKKFPVGSEKTVKLTYADGTSEDAKFAIAGYNLADDKKVVFLMKGFTKQKYKLWEDIDTNLFDGTEVFKSIFPSDAQAVMKKTSNWYNNVKKSGSSYTTNQIRYNVCVFVPAYEQFGFDSKILNPAGTTSMSISGNLGGATAVYKYYPLPEYLAKPYPIFAGKESSDAASFFGLKNGESLITTGRMFGDYQGFVSAQTMIILSSKPGAPIYRDIYPYNAPKDGMSCSIAFAV